MSLKELAAEREERNRARGISMIPDAKESPDTIRLKPVPSRISQSRPTQSARSALNNLKSAHRSIRMGHSVGLMICSFSIFWILFPWVFQTQLLIACIFMAGVWMARSGASFLHSCLPLMFREGDAPSVAEIESHDKNLFLPTLSGTFL